MPRRLVALSFGAAGAVHAILIFFIVAPRGGGYEARGNDLMVVDVPPEVRIPPPPEEIARPATPVIAQSPTLELEEVTIGETTIRENMAVSDAPPPPEPTAPADVTGRYTFTPYTVRPRCTTHCRPGDVVDHVPTLLKRTGFRCVLTVGIHIDRQGRVTATDMLVSSGNNACDLAAEEWARDTSWTVAYNRDEPVAVWIAQPLTIESS
jgi:outer membrane biosynthesis protein TonB